MIDSVICPDCGGVIGENATADVKHCQCATTGYHPSEQQVARAEAQVQAAREESSVVDKHCRVCRRNLVGHRRIKDQHGYICPACAADEKEDLANGLIPCAECSKRLKPAGLIDYHGTRICKKCFADHQEISKFKAPPPKLDLHDKQEKNRLIVLIIIMAILGLIVLLSSLGFLRSG